MSKQFAITSTGQTLRSFFDHRFSGCKFVLLHTQGQNETFIFENPYRDDTSGLKLIKYLNNKGITSVITGEISREVSEFLKISKLQLILLDEEKIRIEEILQRIA